MDCFATIHNNIYLYVISSRSPSLCTNVKKNARLYSLKAASGQSPYDDEFYNVLKVEGDYIYDVYVPNIYNVHFIDRVDNPSFHPIDDGVVDEVKEENYFKILMKMLRKINIITGQGK